MHFVLARRKYTMKRSVLIATIITAVALVPVAVLRDDYLIPSLAGLIPLYVAWRNGDLN